MPEMSYDELEASACGIYIYEPGPDGKHILRTKPDVGAMESRRISVPKLWAGPYKSRFRERFTPTPTPPCSSADEAEYETSPEDAELEYEECLTIPPKSELRNGGLGLPHNKNRGAQVIDSILHGDEEIDGVDANIDLSLIDGSCPVFALHRNAALPPVPQRSPRRPVSMSMENDIKMRQDSSFTIPPLNTERRRSNNDSSNETLVDSVADGTSRSSPKSVTPPEHTIAHQGHSTQLSTASATSINHVSLASVRRDLATFALDEEDADDEMDNQNQKVYLQENKHSKEDGKFKAACAPQRGKQSLDDKYLMDLMQVHPAVRMEAFKRGLHVPRHGPKAASAQGQEKRTKGYRYNDLDDLVPGEQSRK